MIRCALSAAGLALVVAFSTAPAKAQQGASPAPQAGEESRSVEEIVVTSRINAFRPPVVGAGVLGDRDPLDVPFSITSFNRDLIELQQAVTPADVLKNDPSITSSATEADAALYAQIRGFNAGTLFNGMNAFGSDLSQGNFAVFNVERLEVLKGVSAFLNGAVATAPVGGTINFIPKRPLATDLTRIVVGLADRSRGIAHADISRRFGPNDELGVRVNLASIRGQTPVDDTNFRTDVAAIAIDWAINDRADVLVGAEYTDNFDRGYRDRFFEIPSDIAIPAPPNPRRNFAQPWSENFNAPLTFFADARFAISDNWQIRFKGLTQTNNRGFISAYSAINDAAGNLTIFASTDPDQQINSDALDLTINGRFATGPIQHDLTISANWTEADYFINTNFGELTAPPIPQNLYRPFVSPRPVFLTADQLDPIRALVNRGSGIAVADIMSIGDQWQILVGARYQAISGERYFGPGGALSFEYDSSRVTPIAALIFKPTENFSLFAHYAEGLEPGGTAPPNTVNAFEQLGPRVAEQIEAGLKWELPSNLLLTATLFQIDRALEFVNAERRFVQAGTQRHQGFELFASGPVTENLSMVGGVTIFDATQVATGNAARDGKTAPGVPSFTTSLNLDYEVPLVSGLGVYGGVFHVGRQYFDTLEQQRVAAWTRVDVGARYRFSAGSTRFTVRANLDNLFDRRYWASAGRGLQIGSPRTWRISLAADF